MNSSSNGWQGDMHYFGMPYIPSILIISIPGPTDQYSRLYMEWAD